MGKNAKRKYANVCLCVCVYKTTGMSKGMVRSVYTEECKEASVCVCE